LNRIKDVNAMSLSVPLKTDLSHSGGSHPGRFVMTLIRLETEHGTGFGEGGGGGFSFKPFIDRIADQLIGEDADNINRLKWKVASPITSTYYNQLLPQLWFPIETALLDVKGKRLGIPVSNLYGGAFRNEVEAAAYFFTDSEAVDMDEELERAVKLVRSGNFNVLKVKAGVYTPAHEVDFLLALVERLGNIKLRVDPNGAWNLGDALFFARRCEDEGINIEYFEDPVWSMEGMRSFRSSTKYPLATNTVVIRNEDLAPAFLNKAVDVVLGDPHWWYGGMGFLSLASTIWSLGMEIGMHSPGELGIGLAAMLHAASSISNLSYPIDTHYVHLSGDILKHSFSFSEGKLEVPQRPGLGVDLDESKVLKYQELYREQGDYVYHADPGRNSFIPTIPRTGFKKCECHRG